MAIRKIFKVNEPEEYEVLRKKSKQVDVFDDRLNALIEDMKDTLKKADGAGLSAVQVGILKRCFVMLNKNHKPEWVINPEIISSSGKNKYTLEGCLSLPNICGEVERPNEVNVRYQDINGKTIEKTFTAFQAKTFCHELDHLDGILYKDKAFKMYKSYDEYFKLKEKKEKKEAKKKEKENKS